MSPDMPSKPVTWGLLSTARINRHIIAAVAESDRCEIVAVASRSQDAADRYAQEKGIAVAHGNYDALLADPAVEAVYISLPNGMHVDWTIRALEAGKHVLCEKPFSRHPAEVERAFDLSDRAGLVLSEGFMWRHNPQAEGIVSLVRDGAIGPLRMLRASFSFQLGPVHGPDDTRFDPSLDGGSLMDVGCYCLSAMRLIAGEPTQVTGMQFVGPSGVDVAFAGTAEFANGVLGHFDCGFVLPLRHELEVVGEDGSLFVADPWHIKSAGIDDPWVSIGPSGVAHQIALSFNNTDAREAILYSRSPDGGRTWGEPVTLTSDTSPLAGLDKESITADPKRARFVYATWDRSSTEAGPFTEPTWFTRSTDGGRTWEPARIIYDPGIDNGTIGNQIVVLPNGDLLNVMAVFVGAGIKLAVLRSTDRGATWSAPLFIDDIATIGITDAKTGEPVRTSDFLPDIAVDPRTGRTYIVWQDARPSGGQRDGIVISSSADGGRTWSSPVQVNGAPQAQAFTPSVDVDRDGKVAVGYYDFRNDSTDPAVLLTNTWLATSRDRGRTFTDRAVGSTFDMRTAPDAGGFFVGDYQGLDHTDEGFAWLYVAANSGDLVNRTDAFISLPGDKGHDAGGGRGDDNNPTPRSARQLLDDHHRRSAR